MHIVKKLTSLFISILLTALCALSIFAGSSRGITPAASPGTLFSFDQKDGTVKRAKQDITGKIEQKSSVERVTYEVYADTDNGELSFTGDAAVTDSSFTISGLKLKPGGNRIAVKAISAAGKTETQVIKINYDAGSIKDVPMKDVAKINGSELKYVTNNLLVFFDECTDDTQRQAIIDTVGGKCAGSANGINMWQVEVKADTYEGLEQTAEKLEAIDGVFGAHCNMAQAAKTMAIPVDPWNNYNWNEYNPQGSNWSVEAIQALSAWDYQYFFNNIKVGIVDAGINNEHEDLTGKVYFPDAQSAAENDPTDNHGTHVAGIIGAIPNNNKGVTGILWNTTIYAYNWNTPTGTDAHLYAGLSKTVQAGAKVVNFSLGLAEDISGYGAPNVNQYVIDYAELSKDYMVPLLNAGYEFIVVQSAGNGQGGYSQDAIYNGYFCSVTYSNLTGISNEMKQKINERIIIVGSADRTGTLLSFIQASTSNAGSQVDICAPGVSVWSCYANNTYNLMSGTSMAAPVVAGTAALAWSVKPTLTGAEVRNLVLNNTAYNVADNTSAYHPLNNTYRMVNAKLAVEAAIATIPVDYSAVNLAVAAANTLNAANYTPASWADLTNAVNAVVYNLESKYQEQINTFAQNINTAISNLAVYYTVEYRLNSETGSKIAVDKTGTGQVTTTVTEAPLVISGYSPMNATKNLTLAPENNVIIFVYIERPVYSVVLNTYKSVNGQLVPVTAAAAGDEIVVTVTPSTNFYCATSKFVVMYDKSFYTIVGSGNSAFTMNPENAYYQNTVTSYTGKTAPTDTWPATFTQGESAVYNIATAAFTTGLGSANGGFPTVMNDGQWLYSFKLRVNAGAAGSGRIFMDHRWTKTNSNTSGPQYLYACANATSPNTAGNSTMDFLPDLTQADRSVTFAVPLTVSFSLNGGTGTIPAEQIGLPGMPMTLPAQGNINRQYFSFAGWAETSEASEPLASFNFPASDAVLYAVWHKIPAELNYTPGGAVIDENNMIYGIEPGTTKNSFTVTGNYSLIFTPGSEVLSTGTRLDVIDNETFETVSTYQIVIFGDVNGDGNIDSLDAATIVDHENYLVPWNDPDELCFKIAADANNDGNRDSIDAGIIVDSENYILLIDQRKGSFQE